ncbi:MAG: 16S rRNA (adenine(1518)-N(6)/adenine(1519)-N(6))-dimethyltransferase RsmA [Oscillospiraceae bacterium]|jgi:16S rRNA (adenine1518-N6/adenine1519-N6)-dimethyltransferase|nr:16S rRNA (adenine(1518)-N(6)/adenine(1519)-N(6))-dimethyltransferase RsmA [Oscillospiraceae bacterium]
MNLTNINTIKDLFARHGFSFTKPLGQNFLINPSVCPRITKAATAPSGKEGRREGLYAFEIGAGIGVLTKELAKICKKVICVEIDESLKPILAETLAGCPNVEIIWGDVLKLDLKRLFKEKFNVPAVCSSAEENEIIVCANLPYYITSPVIMRLLEERLPLKSITVMVQKEAAVRLCAPPGTRDCGAVSAAVRYYSTPKKLFDVSRGSFMPAPNVDSAVIHLDVRNAGDDVLGVPQSDEAFFFRIIRASFSQRRKQLANPLSSELGLQKEAIKNALSAIGLKPTSRAEELTLEDFAELYKIVK